MLSLRRATFAAVGAIVACSSEAPITFEEEIAQCTNGIKDDDESDVDCGGPCLARCNALSTCGLDDDCGSSLVCVKDVCASKTSTDGVQNGSETDIDCGGPDAPPCDVDGRCLEGRDCAEKICVDGTCAPPSPTDGAQNGSETDIDCGGPDAPPCDVGRRCLEGSDCTEKVCADGTCAPPSPTDGVQNGSETDVDCGGGAPAAECEPGKKCEVGSRDCTSKVCGDGTCLEPRPDDGVQNGDETGIDCGGAKPTTPRCGAGVGCLVDSDCASDGCAFDKTCAVGRSCTAYLGGRTCGAGEVGAGNADHESCCARAPLSTGVLMDKYHVTAGRMRAFIERTNGNVRAFAKTTAGWSTAWDNLVPGTIAQANTMLGSYWTGAPNDSSQSDQSKRSCAPGYFGGHTYWTPPTTTDYSDFTKDELDVKGLNCVGWHLARAFCSWEGGRLPSSAEITNAFKNGNTTTYPWGNGTYNADQQDSRLNHQFNYGFPNKPGRRLLSGGAAADIAWHVSPPGRFPLGKNQQGIEIAGNLLHWSNEPYTFVWSLSWEGHHGNLNSQNWQTTWPHEPNGYYAIGFRCVYP